MPIDTSLLEKATDEIRKTLTELIPLGRLGEFEKVAAGATGCLENPSERPATRTTNPPAFVSRLWESQGMVFALSCRRPV